LRIGHGKGKGFDFAGNHHFVMTGGYAEHQFHKNEPKFTLSIDSTYAVPDFIPPIFANLR